MLHTINTKENVSQKVLRSVGSSFFTFFIISTKLRQNITAKIGEKYTLIKGNMISINNLHHPKQVIVS